MSDLALIQKQVIDWRRELHQYPELSGQETATTERIQTWLKQYDIAIAPYALKTGIIAEIGTGYPIVAIRADIDALPIHEDHQRGYCSVHPGVMHACGHDLHTAVILGAAVLLKQHEAKLKGRIRIIFQPAEETYSGAYEVLDAGALDDVSAIFGMHNEPSFPVGTFATRSGAFYANVDRFNITIKGKGAHAGRPHEGHDAIVIASQFINSIQTVASRSINNLETCVVSVTQIHAGNTWNVLPESVALEGTARTHNADTRAAVEQKIKRIASGIALANSAEILVDWQNGPSAVINTPEWARFSEKVALTQGYNVIEAPLHLGGEDFAAYLEHIPGAFVSIGSASEYGLHHPQFAPDDALIFPASQYFYQLAIQALEYVHQQTEG